MDAPLEDGQICCVFQRGKIWNTFVHTVVLLSEFSRVGFQRVFSRLIYLSNMFSRFFLRFFNLCKQHILQVFLWVFPWLHDASCFCKCFYIFSDGPFMNHFSNQFHVYSQIEKCFTVQNINVIILKDKFHTVFVSKNSRHFFFLRIVRVRGLVRLRALCLSFLTFTFSYLQIKLWIGLYNAVNFLK